ncbi:Lrp/AsnC family transcriptional regulator [Nocardia terpenica]|nr:Lrp/AsnC family transcriptional regulator [Nocardia terpenica]MBF6102663.1 Lrp/AsnC family transcriptional regulator [Nocardia terpenica]MBF6111146.1 Lrp/AsnC family transcriptional regulator [Nocardia terpenica]MBF6117277.1 Lrp/AsnC family transcriptional regulator [Nocardia terpenica]MBF6150882.1 Lrp/AsnC family transcriptional regulator [Nocardia terpenica]
MVLDEVDYLLLELVQADAAQPLHTLGDRVGLSPSAVQRRLTRLRAAGVIRAEVAVIDPLAVGVTATSVVLVELTGDYADAYAAFRARMLAEPAVQQCYSVLGQWDYVVVMANADLAEYRRISHELFVEDKSVLRYETLLTYERIKAQLAVPLPPRPQRG